MIQANQIEAIILTHASMEWWMKSDESNGYRIPQLLQNIG